MSTASSTPVTAIGIVEHSRTFLPLSLTLGPSAHRPLLAPPSSPSALRPQHAMRPSRLRAQAELGPAAICTASSSSTTFVGAVVASLPPLPSSPTWLCPQHCTWPPLRAQVNDPPAAISSACTFATRTGFSFSTSSPSAPPQHHTPWAPSSAHVCRHPADTATMSVSAGT
jgi:hypothetical protein